MRYLCSLTAIVFLAAGPARPQDPKNLGDLKSLEGRWLIPHRALTPAAMKGEVARRLLNLGNEVEITDGKLVARDRDKKGIFLNLVVDPNTYPKAIDLKVPGKKDQVLYGIYQVDHDILSLVIGTGNERPRDFKCTKDQVLLVLKRKRFYP